MVTKHLARRNRAYYFFNDSVFLNEFDPKMLRLVKNNCGIDIFIILIMLKKVYT